MMDDDQPSDNFKILLIAACVTVFLLIVVGGIVRVTTSGEGCPDWPTCFVSFTPPIQGQAVWDYAHRALSFIVALLVGASAYQARRSYRRQAWISRPVYAAAGTLGIQIALGALLATQAPAGGDRILSAIHLGLSLLIQAFMLAATAAVFYISAERSIPQPNFKAPFARLALATLGVAFLLLVSGAAVSGLQGGEACPTWPLCTGGEALNQPGLWASLAHRLIAATAGIFVYFLFSRAWRTQRGSTPVMVSATATAVLFFAQALLGAKLVQGFPMHLLVLHEASATAEE